MRRNPLYGGSQPAEPEAPAPVAAPRLQRLRGFARRRQRPLLVAAGGAAGLAAFVVYLALHPPAHTYTQAEINAAVEYALKHRPPEPSRASVAAETVRPSVVRVTGYDTPKPAEQDAAKGIPKGATPLGPETDDDAVSVGSGVVIDERGTILTNLHVAASAKRLKVTFANGQESDAYIVGAQPEDDLAVIRPDILPDDLKPATLVSTRGMRPGDEVVAVGFPFAIGPSVSAGVVSGLGRSWASSTDPGRSGGQNLIQFDAAANPGNSGGPLVNRNGEVVGIVTGILNPTKQRVFIGIGFAVPIENAARAAGQSPF
jgi:S1-C subfamily serine protease